MEELKKMMEFTGVDVTSLVDECVSVLKKYKHPATRLGVIAMLKEWVKEKDYLIRQVMAMPGYNGNLQAISYIEVDRERTIDDVRRAVDRIWDEVFGKGDKLLSRVNEDGKTLTDLISEELSNLPKMVDISKIAEYGGKVNKSYTDFNHEGYTKKSITNKYKASEIINYFGYIRESRIDAEAAKLLNGVNEKFRAAADMKTTRAMGKFIKLYGLEDKTAGSAYGKAYISDYCEVMKDVPIKYMFVVSVHPVDYLMSSTRTTGWKSCHNIIDGHWKSGTISYMLDKVTLVTYALRRGDEMIDKTTGEVIEAKARPEMFNKVYRDLFHWDEKQRLIQNRIYPQGNDGATDLYAVFRHEMQRQISLANGLDPDAWVMRNQKHINFCRDGEGKTNYSDWHAQGTNVKLSTPKTPDGTYNTDEMVIGAEPICVKCGNRHRRTYSLVCGRC